VTKGVGVLLVAKAPVAGLAKTRIGSDVGDEAAAEIAAACLLDTLDVVEDWVAPADRVIALTGDLAMSARGGEIAARLEHWSLVRQRGDGLAERILNAHEDAARCWGKDQIVVQLGMDTPSVTTADLFDLAWPVVKGIADAGLGLAADGGWWGLVSRRLTSIRSIVDVPMSRPDTGALTLTRLTANGSAIGLGRVLRDVDGLDDAMAVAETIPHSHLAEALVRLAAVTR
jgi:glycosyltransferase A (GT-A) superfamily protein (DUF2064 family)